MLEFFPKVQLEVEVKFVQDTLKGDDQTEIRVKFVKKLEDAIPAGENWINKYKQIPVLYLVQNID